MVKIPVYRMGTTAAPRAANVGCSVEKATSRPREPAVRNCTKDRHTPSTSGEKWSITRMWNANSTAPLSISISPMARLKVLSVKHRKYSPTHANATLTHKIGFGRFFKKMPSTGTSTTYSAVRKPALPAVV